MKRIWRISPERNRRGESSRRRLYVKAESVRRSSSSLMDDERDDKRKRIERDFDGFDRRKVFDRYRDGGGGFDRGSSTRGERMKRSESFGSIRRDFDKGFVPERDRLLRERCGGLSWRRLSCGKDCEDRGGIGSRDLSNGEKKMEFEKVGRERCSSSEMEEGEVEVDRISEHFDGGGKDEKEVEIENLCEGDSEMKDEFLSMKELDFGNGDSCGERSMEIGVRQGSRNVVLEEEIEVVEKLDEELKEGGEDLDELQGGAEDLVGDVCKVGMVEVNSVGEKEELARDVSKEEKVEDNSFGEKEKRIIGDGESSYLPSQSPKFEMKNQAEEPVIQDDELVTVLTSSREGKSEVCLREVNVDVEKEEEKCVNIGVVLSKDKGIDQVGFGAEQRKGKGIDIQSANFGEYGYCNSFKKIKSENNLTFMAENPRDKGKSIAQSPSSRADSAEDENAVEGPSRRGFELVFQDQIIQSDNFGGRIKNEKLKLEPLDLSLGLPGVLPEQSSKPPNTRPNSPGGTRSIQSFPSSFRTISDGCTNSISFSSSQLFAHNPSCSLTQNSVDNFEQSVGSHPIFQGVDQVSISGLRQSQASMETKRKGGAGALFHRVLLNGNHSQNSMPSMNGHHNLKSNSLLRQHSFPRQPSPPQSVRSREMLSERSKDKRMLAREKSFKSLSRNDHREGEQIVVNAPSVVERIITRMVSEPLQVMERMLQDMSEHSKEFLKDSICKMLGDTDKPGQIHALQGTLRKRSDLTAETMTRCSQTLMEILVALKTGLPDFLQRSNNVSSFDLIEIFHNLKCRNLACRNVLPVDDCDCKICSEKNGFCSACMCLICSKFDMTSNTCSWVGCDLCLHWCHTDCGLRNSHIRNGQSSLVSHGATEMQFHCVACGHPSEMFGFVKEVFKMCSKDWKVENLVNELQYVRRIFCGSNDVRGKSLYQIAGQMQVKLEDKKRHHEVIRNIMSFLSESEPTINNSPPPEPSGTNDQRVVIQAASFPIEETPWLASVSSNKSPHLPHKSSSPAIDNAQMLRQKDSSILQLDFKKKPPIVDELDSIIGFKQAEAKLYQERAENARREADGLKRIAVAKSGKIDDEYGMKMAKLQLQEAEERRRHKMEELRDLERAHHDFVSLKTRMEAEIKDLLLKMDATRRNFNV